MTTITNNCETGLAAGTTVTTTNSDDGTAGQAFGVVAINASTTATYETTSPIQGTRSIQLTSAGNSVTLDLIDGTPATSFTGSVYFELLSGANTANQQIIISLRSSGGFLARMEISATRQVRVVMGATNAAFSTPVLSLNTVYRAELYGTGVGGSAGAATVDIYLGHNTGTPFIRTQVTGATTTGTADRFRYGMPNNGGAFSARLDNFRQNIGSSTPMGPAAVQETVDYVATDAGNTGTSSATTVSCTMPAGAAIGDRAILVVATERAATPALSGVTGWSTAHSASDGTTMSFHIFHKAVEAADPGATITATNSVARRMAIAVFIYDDVGSVEYVLTSSTASAITGAGATFTTPAITPSADNAYQLAVAAVHQNTTPYTWTGTPSSGWTERADAGSASTTSANIFVYAADKLLTAGGGSSQAGLTVTGDSSSRYWAATIALVPQGTISPITHTRTLNDSMGIGDYGYELALVQQATSDMTLTDTLTSSIIAVGVEGWGVPI